MTHNHIGYEGRLDFIKVLLREQFGIEGAEVIPIQYDPKCPFKYNNFVYRISLSSPIPAAHKDKRRQHGIVAVPKGAGEFIIRLTNSDAEGMHPETRVENEVVIISLVAAALRDYEPHIVPSVYGWGSAASPSTQGWILQEMMPGVPIDETFNDMPFEEKKVILAQMAKFLKSLQEYQLPNSIEDYGGVTFDNAGRIVSAAMTSVGSGPWPSYETYFSDRLKRALEKADNNRYINGWHANGIRKRLEAFVESGVPAQFRSLESQDGKSIVHADFTLNNLLYDVSTQRVTALLDYDFACILHPSYEFLRSFSGAGGQFQGWSDIESSDTTALRDAKLHHFPSPLPENGKNGIQWDVAKTWEDELEKLNVKRPRTMKGIEKVADVDGVVRSILPWRVHNSDIVRLQSEDAILKCRNDNEAQLSKLLDHLGY